MLPRYGSYEAIRRLAVGGMGEIFLARQVGIKGFERLAIIKTLLNETQDEEDKVEMFLAEARIAALLNHPNIVQIFEVGEQDGTYFMAMEFVDGDTLSALVRAALRAQQHSPWPFIAFLAQASRALHHAHNQKDPQGKAMELVHRDISPQNIMVRRDGVTKVVDFGIAKVANAGNRTKTGVLKGKVAYMAPEQMRSEPVDGRADLYAIGVVAWELTLGKRMFSNMSDIEIITNVMAGKAPSPRTLQADFPEDLEWVIMKAVAADPADRFQTGNELAEAFEEILRRRPDDVKPDLATFVDTLIGKAVRDRIAEVSSSASISGPTPTSGGTLRTPMSGSFGIAKSVLLEEEAAATAARRKKRMVAASGAFLLAVVAGGAVVALRPKEPESQPVVVVPKPVPTPVPVATPVPEAPKVDAGSGATPEPVVHKDEPDRGKKPLKRPPPVRQTDTRPDREPVTQMVRVEDGFLTLQSEPWAVVTVDGRPAGSTPVFKFKLPPGKHTVKLVNEAQGLSKTETVDIQAGQVTKKAVQLN